MRIVELPFAPGSGGYVLLWAYLPDGTVLYKGTCRDIQSLLRLMPVHHGWCVAGGRGKFVIRGRGSGMFRFERRGGTWYLLRDDVVVATFRSIPRKYIQEFGNG